MNNLEMATLAGGCFWCTEGLFQRLKGVESVTSGYAGGQMRNPTYEDVSSGEAGHAESIQIKFDHKILPYERLLYVFFKTHDPTTLNRQGNDVGSQYRSVIFYHSGEQKKIAEKVKQEQQKDYSSPIVTQIVGFENFYEAEGYHQDFYNKNKNYPYCKLVIDPKIQKLQKEFTSYLSSN